MKLNNHLEQDSMKRHYESLVKVIEKKVCLCCDDTQLKRQWWPLEAAVIIKPWATSPGRHHSLLFLNHPHHKDPCFYCHDHHHVDDQNADLGVIIKVRWSPGLTTSLRWASSSSVDAMWGVTPLLATI